MLDEQIVTKFIGHRQELDLFEQWLTSSDPDSPWILFFHDATDIPSQKGGVGKTWLLRKCALMAKQHNKDIAVATVDFFSVADRDGVTIAQRVVESLQAAYPSWSPNAFREALAEYRIAASQHKGVVGTRAKLYETLIKDMEVLDQQLEGTSKRLLVFFDTFELIEDYPIVAILGATTAQTFPNDYYFRHIGVVIAGRNGPDWMHQNWKGREHEVTCVPIQPFNREEMVQFINNQCTTLTSFLDAQSEQAIKLYNRTSGRPILVGLVTDVLNHRISTLDELVDIPPLDFERAMVTQINLLEQPINWVVLFMAHIYHRFNSALLDWIFDHSFIRDQVEDVDREMLVRDLLNLSFVRSSESGDLLALHDEMRRLVNTYNWTAQEQQTKMYRRELSLVTITYYEHELEKQLDEQTRHTYRVEMLHHKLFVDLNEGFAFFEEHFHRAIELWQNAIARSLFQEFQEAHKLSAHQLSNEQGYSIMLDEASLLRREANNEAALDLYERLEQEADAAWLDPRRVDILFEKGDCYQQMSSFPEAIACFNEALKLTPEHKDASRTAEILGSLGYGHRRLGELDKAHDYYEQSIRLYKELHDRRGYADMLSSSGGLYRLQGKLEEALRRCMTAWRIRSDLAERGMASEIGVAYSLDAIGAIYLKMGDLVSAQKFFEDAYEIYERNQHRGGIASINGRFGQVAMAKNALPEATRRFQTAYEDSLGFDAETEINSLNKWGWAFVVQDRWEEAIPFLEKAIERAREVRDYYQRAESLVDLAFVLEHLELHEQSQHAMQEAQAIASEYNYYYLLGLAEVSRGDNAYNTGNYQEAFKHFGVHCYYMALYNPVEYEKAVRKTTSSLFNLSVQTIPSVVADLKAYWSSVDLQNKGLFLNALEEVDLLIGL